MFRSMLILPLVAAGALAGIPYLLSNSNVDTMVTGQTEGETNRKIATLASSDPAATTDGPALMSAPAAPVDDVPAQASVSSWNVDPMTGELRPAETAAAASGPRTYHLAEVIRFDISPEWILRNWSRVSMDRFKPGLEGYRVALVTGTGPHDLAGSLTYYFDVKRKLSHITFYGTTGDWQRLASLLTQRYGFRRRDVEGTSGQLLVVSKFDQTLSWCQIDSVDVVDSQRIHSRYRVSLNMMRPLTMQ